MFEMLACLSCNAVGHDRSFGWCIAQHGCDLQGAGETPHFGGIEAASIYRQPGSV
jgi:hypothetical protein